MPNNNVVFYLFHDYLFSWKDTKICISIQIFWLEDKCDWAVSQLMQPVAYSEYMALEILLPTLIWIGIDYFKIVWLYCCG